MARVRARVESSDVAPERMVRFLGWVGAWGLKLLVFEIRVYVEL